MYTMNLSTIPMSENCIKSRIIERLFALFLAAFFVITAPAAAADQPQGNPPETGNANEAEPQFFRYRDFGAKGDGQTNDAEAIVKAHAAANKTGTPVRADEGAVYYIGNAAETAIIQTDTDWKNATFIIDDSKIEVKDSRRQIFQVSSPLQGSSLKSIETLSKNQAKIDGIFPGGALISVIDKSTMQFIRYGANQNNGTARSDVFVVNEQGEVDSRTPIEWDYANISSIAATPIDPKTLTIRNGNFITIANQAESKYTYYSRGLLVTRSNVVVDGLTHTIKEELDHGSPYGGFISVQSCANVTVQNCSLSGHRFYKTIGSANVPVSMGTYDLSLGKACNITIKNCRQINDIQDRTLWGIMGSNFTKNVILDHVEFSRYDAHMGVVNLTIRDSVFGHVGINLIGSGAFLIENSKVFGRSFINLRGDYGSTFNGTVTIRNCEFTPGNGEKRIPCLVTGNYSGQHDFGYTCYMPRKIIIDGLLIHDGNSADKAKGPRIFSNFNSEFTNANYVEKRPYVITEEVEIHNMKTDSGKPFIVSDNSWMFRNVKIIEK